MHTPGPWIASNVNSPAEDIATAIWQNDGTPDYWERTSQVGECHYYEEGDEKFEHQDARLISVDEARANAKLIGAAPELLALAERYASECVECTGDGVIDATGDMCQGCADIRAVIRKATGR